ncbi:hypothetical protein ANN_09567 [Periplaneta americana]|uniref:Niemann-Pick C1 N-terminal domain-containing protein n=1 Tax=Periplaneta americana TaxID=6978 RepID=A0ABQ8TP95_PERAM|nr:hypothetical protein ANN_09567 [Periplaneta americana]
MISVSESSVQTCCDTKQLTTMDNSILLAAAFLQRCPSCLQNLVKHICDMTCGIDQSRFINISELEENEEGVEYINGIDVYLGDEYMNGTYNSCKQVSVPSTSRLALDMMCGEWGASRCSARKWFTYMGQSEGNPFVPFEINYIETNKTVGKFIPLNPSITPCSKGINNIVRNRNIKIGDLSFEEVEKFKYLGATVTNINDTREEIKRKINMGNACYYSVEKLLSSSLLSKNLKVRIYKTVILPVLLYGCETLTLTLREEHRLKVFENKVLRKIFGAKKDEVTGEWRKLQNAELHALYSSPDIIRNIKSRRLRWAGHVACMGESRNAYRVLVGRPEGKRPLGRPRRRWEDNIKMDLREVGYDDREWINIAQDRDRWRAYVRVAMNLRPDVPACSCVDCEASCPVPPPEPAPPEPFTILGLDGFSVVIGIVWAIGSLLFLTVVFCCCDSNNTIASLVRGEGADEVRHVVGQRLAGINQSRIALGADEEESPLQSKRSTDLHELHKCTSLCENTLTEKIIKLRIQSYAV